MLRLDALTLSGVFCQLCHTQPVPSAWVWSLPLESESWGKGRRAGRGACVFPAILCYLGLPLWVCLIFVVDTERHTRSIRRVALVLSWEKPGKCREGVGPHWGGSWRNVSLSVSSCSLSACTLALATSCWTWGADTQCCSWDLSRRFSLT